MTMDTIREFDRITSSLFANRPNLRAMPMDLFKDGDRYVLTADLPGVDPSSIDIDVDGSQLTIRADRDFSALAEVKWITRERTEGSFVRQLTLGEAIDTEAIAANYDNGVLTVIMPVRESAKPRKVSVSTGAQTENVVVSSSNKLNNKQPQSLEA